MDVVRTVGQVARRAGLLPGSCYSAVIEQRQWTDRRCLTIAASKLIGFALITFSTILKLPQIVKILQSGTAQGLSPAMYALECYAYIVNIAFAVRTGMPFSSFGEGVFILLQNIVILLLIWTLSKGRRLSSLVAGSAALAGLAFALGADIVADSHLHLLRQTSPAVFCVAKLPQIVANFKNRGTGQLSLITQGLQWLGNLARIGTTFGDPGAFSWIVLGDFVLAFVLNGVLTSQILYYGFARSKTTKKD
ncbi:Mannose-P-dolichol utilization defect 1 like protein [Plasmodiophora brassicae]|uniref:Mannose-P-dolichol utilization defect 1 protein homolog n=1 Tax=Plasmodiophora brassicae TaxID=37360 RepID=A0A0G4J851_PLABS|nr:hypothetical protein PBRA_009439 [Plasmodiophora brassicae]SPQ93138.1 unnamed protein product [Plasmodiophora brassicae]